MIAASFIMLLFVRLPKQAVEPRDPEEPAHLDREATLVASSADVDPSAKPTASTSATTA
jgi:hypothetical protein